MNKFYLFFTTFILASSLLLISSCSAQEREITFKVNAQAERVLSLGLRGNVKPLSLKEDFPLTDQDGDGVYEATVRFKTSERRLRFNYVLNDTVELIGCDKRSVWFKEQPLTVSNVYNQFNVLTEDKIAMFTYSQEEIDQDINVLRDALEVIHPNLYKYTDSLTLEKEFATLETAIKNEPTITGVYKHVSKFVATVKCSHTFTNPWNQSAGIEMAAFYKADKLPFTFNRVAKQLFVDRNASEMESLQSGLEILAINSISTEEIMTRLASYISSDGNNYEKKLQRLTLSSLSKFELFDIFFSLEFGSPKVFILKLKNHTTNEIFEIEVAAMTKTSRTRILSNRYSDFKVGGFKETWKFEMITPNVAYLELGSFASFNSSFNWKKFLDQSFKAMKAEKATSLIIDIRGNEGGNTEIVEDVLERIITESISIDTPPQILNYQRIPESLKEYVNTWDKLPFDWGSKVVQQDNGKYVLKSKYSDEGVSYSPRKSAFKGEVYLLTDASNSSATHIMATYIKEYKLASIIGQETGGNQKGLNGGYMFFTRLPNSKVEIDIPVLGINLLRDSPQMYDGGIVPDVLVAKNISDYINGTDTILEKTLEIINQN